MVEGPKPEAFLFDPASNLLEALEGQEASDALSSKSLPEPTSPNARRPQQTPGNRLKRQGNRRFNYDARGNRTEEIIERGARQGQVTRYSYNAQNQLVEVNVAGVVTRYAYDALGRRISKSSEQGNTTFYWNGDVLLGEVGINRSRTYLFEPFSFKPLALVQNSEVFHYHTDHIGTPREITNARAEVVWSSSFKTYGALALAHVNEVDNPLRFQGQYHDEETGLHYNRHRYYDPNCGQFTTQDPIGLLGGMNAYQYAPNPMTWVDPWGLKGEEKSEVGANNKFPSRDTDWFNNVAKNATRNPDSKKLVLGHFSRDSVSYQKVAAHYDATYFKVDDWNTVTKGLSQDEIWQINESFLDQQVIQGKQILFSHDPLKARPASFFEREVSYLRELGYEFRQKNQWTWEAVR